MYIYVQIPRSPHISHIQSYNHASPTPHAMGARPPIGRRARPCRWAALASRGGARRRLEPLLRSEDHQRRPAPRPTTLEEPKSERARGEQTNGDRMRRNPKTTLVSGSGWLCVSFFFHKTTLVSGRGWLWCCWVCSFCFFRDVHG